eukprot:3444573-Prymnesium_polylepis.1
MRRACRTQSLSDRGRSVCRLCSPQCFVWRSDEASSGGPALTVRLWALAARRHQVQLDSSVSRGNLDAALGPPSQLAHQCLHGHGAEPPIGSIPAAQSPEEGAVPAPATRAAASPALDLALLPVRALPLDHRTRSALGGALGEDDVRPMGRGAARRGAIGAHHEKRSLGGGVALLHVVHQVLMREISVHAPGEVRPLSPHV